MLCVILVVMLGMKVCWLIFKVPALLAGSHGSGCVEHACRCGMPLLKVCILHIELSDFLL